MNLLRKASLEQMEEHPHVSETFVEALSLTSDILFPLFCDTTTDIKLVGQ